MKFFPLKFTVEEPPAPKKKSKKGALITLAVALLILLASGALFLARLRKRSTPMRLSMRNISVSSNISSILRWSASTALRNIWRT
jgi:hypothetical protein